MQRHAGIAINTDGAGQVDQADPSTPPPTKTDSERRRSGVPDRPGCYHAGAGVRQAGGSLPIGFTRLQLRTPTGRPLIAAEGDDFACCAGEGDAFMWR